MLTQEQCDPTIPEQAFAWMFAAGVPDSRADAQPGKVFRNQPCIPAACFGALSKLLWEFGCRPNPELQTKWVVPAKGPTSNFSVWETTDTAPAGVDAPADGVEASAQSNAAAMLAEQFPELAGKIAAVTPETHQVALEEQTQALLDSLARLQAAQSTLDAQNAAGAE